MRFLVRAFLFLLLIGTVGLGVAWWWAGREPGPTITIQSPEAFVGQAGSLEFSVEAPGGLLQRVDAVLEQNGQPTPVFSLGADAGEVDPAAPDRLKVARPIGKKAQPALVTGPARLTITAVRPVFYGLRTAESSVTRDLQVRLEPPRVSVASLHHFVNLGGAEFAVLRASPEDAQAGIRVGEATYPAYPGKRSRAVRPGASRRLLCPSPRSEGQHADLGLCQGSRRQRNDDAPRASPVCQGVRAIADSYRSGVSSIASCRPLPRTRRT